MSRPQSSNDATDHGADHGADNRVATGTSDPDDRSAAISVARGRATPEELAALVAVLSAAARAAEDPAQPAPRSEWASRERAVRRPLSPGPGAWRASGWRG